MKTVNIISIVALVAVGAIALMAWSGGNSNTTSAPTASPAMVAQTEGDSMENTAMMAQGNIVETAAEAGSFNTLLAAAKAAGLAETLATTQDITVFAPTDEAFAKLPTGTVESLLADPAKLAEILKYHVVSGTVMADKVVTLSSATTLQGSDVTIKVMGDKVMVNDATVVQADVVASNGVIHVIDTVLLPSM